MYESFSTYERNQNRVEVGSQRKALHQEFLSQIQANQPLRGIQNALGGLGGAVGNAVGGALDILGRPSMAVRGGIQASWDGRDVWQGVSEGWQGRGPANIAGMLQGQGVPTLPVGPFDTRGIAGFGLDLATDPTNLIPFAKLGNLGRQAAGFLPEAAGSINRFVPQGAERITVAGTLEHGFRPTPLGTAAQKTVDANIPLVSGAVQKIADLISPKILARSGMDRTIIAYDSAVADIPNVTGRMTAPLRATQFKAPIDADGYLVLGPEIKVQWHDAFSHSPGKLGLEQWLSPQDLQYIEQYHIASLKIEEDYLGKLAELRKVAPEAAKHFEYPDLVGKKPGEWYVARYAEWPDGDVIRIGREGGMGHGQADFQKARKYDSMEEAKQAGAQPITDPLRNLELQIEDHYRRLAEMELVEALVPLTRQKNLALVENLQAGVVAAERHRSDAGQVKELVSRVQRGETIPPQTLEKFRASFPELIDQMMRSESHTVNRPSVMTRQDPLMPFRQALEGLRGGRAISLEERQAAESLKRDLFTFARGDEVAPERWKAHEARFPDVVAQVQGSESKITRAQAKDLRQQGREIQKGARQRANEILANLRAMRAGEGAMENAIGEGLVSAGREGITPLRTLPGQRDELVIMARQAVLSARDQLRQAKLQVKAAEQANTDSVAGLQSASNKFLANLWFKPEEINQLKAHLEDRANPFFKAIAQASGEVRTLQTGLDFGAGFLQGLPTLARDPKRWLQGQWHALEAFRDPTKHQQYLAENQDFLRQVPGLSIGGGGREFMPGLEATGLLHRGLAEGGKPGEMANSLFLRSQAAFDAFGDYARIEWAKAMLPTAQRAGRMEEMVDLINHATGLVNTRALGINPTQRAVEQTFLYSSAYTRASLALVGDVLSGGLAGQEAATTLSRMLGVGILMYHNLARAANQEPVLDPTDSRFLTLEAGGQRVGPGTVWVAMARLAARSVTSPGSLATLEQTNPLVAFFRNRTSPVASAMWDIAEGETLGGTVLQTKLDVAALIGSRLLPMAFASAVIEGAAGVSSRVFGQDVGSRPPVTDIVTDVGASLAGLRSFDRSASDVRDSIARAQFGKAYDELDPYERVAVERDPEIANRPIPASSRYDRTREMESAFGKFETGVNQQASQVQAGQITKSQFRQGVRQLEQERAVRLEDLGPNPNAGPGATAGPEADRAKYLAFFRQADPNQQPDYDAADAFFASLSPESQAFIEAKQRANFGRLSPEAAQLMDDLWQAKRTLKPYWGTLDTALTRFKLKEQWDDASPAERVVMEKTSRYRQAERYSRDLRERMRRQKPEVDQALAEWYGRVPIAEQSSGGGWGSSSFGGGIRGPSGPSGPGGFGGFGR